jgi:citrate lyase subunit beta/citryl-CoA lyase
MRSKLFVPGARPELFANALVSAADAISIDLEDSVQESRKDAARRDAAAFLGSEPARAAAKVLLVRINALGTPHFEADLMALAGTGVALINLPKVEAAADIRSAVAMLERVESARGVVEPIRLLATIETPRGLRLAAEIASAHPRVAGLQLGLADLFAPLGIDRRNSAGVHAAMFAVRVAAGEAGIFACDGAYPDIGDLDAFRAEAEVAHRLGYVGKSCIHPTQIAIANEVFRASDAEIAHARRVVAFARSAAGREAGVFVVDGKMIDLPLLRRAEAIVAASQR